MPFFFQDCSLNRMKEILLTRGYVALVDDADYEWLSQWKWSALTSGTSKRVYASRHGGILMHREILGLRKGQKGDHKDLNGLNNQRSNLRKATTQQNNANVLPRSGRKYKGAYLSHQGKLRKPWYAMITVNRKFTWIGCFETEIEAAKAYDKAAAKAFGEFARLNFPCQ